MKTPVAIITMMLMLQYNAEGQVEEKTGLDTVVTFNGKLKLILPGRACKQIKKRTLFRQYTSEFKIDKIESACGFDFGRNTTYRFFCTRIDNREKNDGGLTTWKLIQSFTDKIPNSNWIKSGITRTSAGLLYFVNLAYTVNGESRFSKFVFFPCEGKLAFALFQCPENELSKWESYCNTDLKPVIQNTANRSRLAIF